MNQALKQLLNHPSIVRTNELNPAHQALGTGFKPLDAQLYHKGWPNMSIIEIIYPALGLGDLALLAPTLKHLTHQTEQSPWVILINPPAAPYAPLLVETGIQLNKLIIIDGIPLAQQLWAAEHSLQKGHTVIFWESKETIKDSPLKRLHLSCQSAQTRCFLFRTKKSITYSSVANTRLEMMNIYPSDHAMIYIKLLKNKGLNIDTLIKLPSPIRPTSIKTLKDLALQSSHLFVHQRHTLQHTGQNNLPESNQNSTPNSMQNNVQNSTQQKPPHESTDRHAFANPCQSTNLH